MTSPTDNTEITIRLLDQGDLVALARLAQRDSAAVPALPALGAELGGGLIAALEIGTSDGRVIADPFVPTEQIVRLLELRRIQIRDEARPRRSRAMRLTHSRGGLGSSPPGGGGRLLQL